MTCSNSTKSATTRLESMAGIAQIVPLAGVLLVVWCTASSNEVHSRSAVGRQGSLEASRGASYRTEPWSEVSGSSRSLKMPSIIARRSPAPSSGHSPNAPLPGRAGSAAWSVACTSPVGRGQHRVVTVYRQLDVVALLEPCLRDPGLATAGLRLSRLLLCVRHAESMYD